MIQLSIMSADAKRAEPNRREIERKAWQDAIDAQRPIRVEQLVGQVFNFAKCKIESAEYSYCQVTITDDEFFLWKPWNNEELREAIAEVIGLLKLAGYKVSNFYEYSKGWKTRSGKFGYLDISW